MAYKEDGGFGSVPWVAPNSGGPNAPWWDRRAIEGQAESAELPNLQNDSIRILPEAWESLRAGFTLTADIGLKPEEKVTELIEPVLPRPLKERVVERVRSAPDAVARVAVGFVTLFSMGEAMEPVDMPRSEPARPVEARTEAELLIPPKPVELVDLEVEDRADRTGGIVFGGVTKEEAVVADRQGGIEPESQPKAIEAMEQPVLPMAVEVVERVIFQAPVAEIVGEAEAGKTVVESEPQVEEQAVVLSEALLESMAPVLAESGFDVKDPSFRASTAWVRSDEGYKPEFGLIGGDESKPLALTFVMQESDDVTRIGLVNWLSVGEATPESIEKLDQKQMTVAVFEPENSGRTDGFDFVGKAGGERVFLFPDLWDKEGVFNPKAPLAGFYEGAFIPIEPQEEPVGTVLLKTVCRGGEGGVTCAVVIPEPVVPEQGKVVPGLASLVPEGLTLDQVRPEPVKEIPVEIERANRMATVAAKGLNMRTGPGTDYSVVKTLTQDTVVEITGWDDQSGWLETRLIDQKTGEVIKDEKGDEIKGWLSGGVDYVTYDKDWVERNLPVAVIPDLPKAAPTPVPQSPVVVPVSTPGVPGVEKVDPPEGASKMPNGFYASKEGDQYIMHAPNNVACGYLTTRPDGNLVWIMEAPYSGREVSKEEILASLEEIFAYNLTEAHRNLIWTAVDRYYHLWTPSQMAAFADLVDTISVREGSVSRVAGSGWIEIARMVLETGNYVVAGQDFRDLVVFEVITHEMDHLVQFELVRLGGGNFLGLRWTVVDYEHMAHLSSLDIFSKGLRERGVDPNISKRYQKIQVKIQSFYYN